MKTLSLLASLLITLLLNSALNAADAIPEIESSVADATHYPGYFDFYYTPEGNILLRIDRFDAEFLYVNSLATGIGSNDIGLDRGQLDNGRVVKFERHGNKVFLKHINLQYRAQSDNELERLAVEEAFAESILWGWTIDAESDGEVLVDITDFLLSDAHGISNTLSAGNQGNYSIDQSRSAIFEPRTRNFPLNSEFEAQLTYTTSARGGNLVRTVTPSPQSITVRLHHSFVQLPDAGYSPRAFHPESGFWSRSFEDYAAPINADMTQRYIPRHRLEKQNPGASSSPAVEPISYYLDPGVPEPVRSALLDGARWWSDAFAAIGFSDGFQVEMLPADADPMDIRYNVIQWVHRSTRGWSYGSSIVDPRTGEIIKGKVTLGSLRVRQDYRIAQSLIGLATEGADESIQELALSRIRQLSAHEVGHTLGIAHNFAASVNDRASVMDYPHPLLEIDDRGLLDALNAYDIGLGDWDYQVIKYGYSEYGTAEEENAGLANTLAENRERGLYFISDQDSRPAGSAHPLSHMWDNGADPGNELLRLMNVRAEALQRFGAGNLRNGQPYAELEEILVPLYFLHRYQVEAVQKILGGTYYHYAVYEEGAVPGESLVLPVAAEAQWQALDALLQTLSAEALVIPKQVLDLIPPKPLGYERTRESFPLRTALGIDYAAIAETAAAHTINGILQPERLARLNNLHGLDDSLPSVDGVLGRLLEQVYFQSGASGQEGVIQRAVNNALLYRMLTLARSEDTDNQVKAQIAMSLRNLERWLGEQLDNTEDSQWLASYQLAHDEITGWLSRGSDASTLTAPLPMPPGAPI